MGLLTYDDFLNESNISKRLSDKEVKERESLLTKNLQQFIEICNKHKVRYWLDGGTLLGLYRDKAFIPGDSDNDVGIHAEDITLEFLEEIGANGKYPIAKQSFWNVNDLIKQTEIDEFVPIKCMKYVSLDGNKKPVMIKDYIWTDIYFYYPFKNDYIYYCANVYYSIPKKHIDGFKSMTRSGFTYSIPGNVEKYLEHEYGKGWVSPDPNYRSYEDPERYKFVTKKDEFVKKNGRFLWNFKKKESKLEK